MPRSDWKRVIPDCRRESPNRGVKGLSPLCLPRASLSTGAWFEFDRPDWTGGCRSSKVGQLRISAYLPTEITA
jgi:hypothetical protein